MGRSRRAILQPRHRKNPDEKKKLVDAALNWYQNSERVTL